MSKKQPILLILFLLCSTAAAAPLIGQVAQQAGFPGGIFWHNEQIVFSDVTGILPEGFLATVDQGGLRIRSDAAAPAGLYEFDIEATIVFKPRPQWEWLSIPLKYTGTVQWLLFPEPQVPFFNGFGTVVIMPAPSPDSSGTDP